MPSKEYTIMKFQIIRAALDEDFGSRIPDAYLYAWDADVYPVFHDGAVWHQAFEDDFRVTKSMMEELVKRLDTAWDGGAGTAPTFYELEGIYGGRSGNGNWDRGELISALRYAALCGDRFDPQFFQQITRDHQAPTEANGFAQPFDRSRDIYFY